MPRISKILLSYMVVLLLNCGSLVAQFQISGKVENMDNQPIEGAEVLLMQEDSTISKTEFTDEKGVFIIEAKSGNYFIQISYIDKILYNKPLVLTQNTVLETIKTSQVSASIDAVIIQAYKPVIRREFDKIIFSVENSPYKIGNDALTLLQKTPKVRVNANGEVFLRNLSPLVMVNGRRLNLSGQDLANYLSNLNSENVKSIEIQTVGSANTDANSSGGVINIVLKKQALGFRSMAKAYYKYRRDNFGVYGGALTTNYGSEKWNFYTQLSYRRDHEYAYYHTRRNLFFNNGYNECIGEADGILKTLNGSGGIVFTPNTKHEFGVEVYRNSYTTKHESTQNIDIIEEKVITNKAKNTPQSSTNTQLWYTTLNYKYATDALGSTLKFIGDVGQNKASNENITNIVYNFPANTNNSSNLFSTNAPTFYYTLQGDWEQKTTKSWEFATGIKYGSITRDNNLNIFLRQDENWEKTATGQQDFGNNEAILAGYGSFAIKFKQKHSLKTGLRVENTVLKGVNNLTGENYNLNYTKLFPSLNYGYDIKEDQNISFAYARRIQRPSFTDLNPFVTKENDYSYITGNTRLNPQYTHKVELSYQLKTHYFSVYGDYTNNIIWGVYRNVNNVSYYQPQNLGAAREIGFDYSHDQNFTNWLYVNMSAGIYHYAFEVENLKPQRLSYYANATASITITPTFSVEIYNSLNSRFQYTVTNNAIQYTMNVVLQKTFWKENGIIKLHCEDVFNTTRDKNISSYENFNFEFYQKRITRAFALVFIYNFNNQKKLNEKTIQSGNESRGRI